VDGTWFVDLSGRFDLTEGQVIETQLNSDDITVTWSATTFVDPDIGFRPDRDTIELSSFAPLSPITIAIDGEQLPSMETNRAGQLSLPVGEYDIDVRAGASVVASDGISVVERTVPLLTYDVFDSEAGLASGTTDLADGTDLYIELWMAPTGVDEPNEYQTAFTTVVDGRWSVSFDPPQPGLVVLVTNVGGGQPWVEVLYDFEG
jgi:hypothetical protein